jgi:hypothetical protein
MFGFPHACVATVPVPAGVALPPSLVRVPPELSERAGVTGLLTFAAKRWRPTASGPSTGIQQREVTIPDDIMLHCIQETQRELSIPSSAEASSRRNTSPAPDTLIATPSAPAALTVVAHEIGIRIEHDEVKREFVSDARIQFSHNPLSVAASPACLCRKCACILCKKAWLT